MPVVLNAELLVALEERWTRHGVPGSRELRAGLSEEQIDTLLKPTGLRLPYEARVWWGWHDGGPGEIGVDLPFMSLSQALGSYRWLLETAARIGQPPEVLWERHWFPLAMPSLGPIAVDCSL